MKSISKREKKLLTYCEKGTPKYLVTRVISNGTYKLYKYENKDFTYLKTRKNDPLFKEVN